MLSQHEMINVLNVSPSVVSSTLAATIATHTQATAATLVDLGAFEGLWRDMRWSVTWYAIYKSEKFTARFRPSDVTLVPLASLLPLQLDAHAFWPPPPRRRRRSLDCSEGCGLRVSSCHRMRNIPVV